MASSRAKGYIVDFNPKPQTEHLIGLVNRVLAEQRAYLPLTNRQVFYRLVGQHGYDKTEQAYARLCEAVVKGRRAGVISWHDIRDDGTVEHHAGGYDDVAQWWRGQLYQAKGFTRDRSEGQDVRIEVWCEAAGMAPQLAKAVRDYGVPVFSTGGFSSVTVTYEIAQRVVSEERPTVFMHVGDYDPSGESIFDAMAQDVGAFVAGDCDCNFDRSDPLDGLAAQDLFEPVRVALTQHQVTTYDLPTAPPKKSDSRSARWVGQTCQAEAMSPGDLNAILIRAVESRYDMDVFERVVEEEESQREEIVTEVKKNIDARSDD
jgi:hypothetical protein